MDSIEELADSIQRGVKELAEENAALRGEVDKLRESVSMCIDERNGLWEEVVRLKAALSRYREAVEWACDEGIAVNVYGKEMVYVDNFRAELRRRAGEGE